MASRYKNRKRYVDYGLPGATPLWQTQSCPYIRAFIDLSVPVPYSLTVCFPFPRKLIGCSGGYHPEDMEEHKNYIAYDMKQRQVLCAIIGLEDSAFCAKRRFSLPVGVLRCMHAHLRAVVAHLPLDPASLETGGSKRIYGFNCPWRAPFNE